MLDLVALDGQDAGQDQGQNQGHDAALRTAAALRADPAHMPAAALLRGDLLLATRHPAEAADSFGTEYRAAPSPALLVRLVRSLVAAGRPADAETALAARLASQPDDPVALRMGADLDMQANRWAAAQARLERLLARRGVDGAALNNLAWVYDARHDPRALDTARRAYALQPTPERADTLGWLMLHADAPGPALRLLQEAAVPPDNPAGRYHLAVALKQLGRKDEAATVLRALAADPAEFSDKPAARALLTELDGGR